MRNFAAALALASAALVNANAATVTAFSDNFEGTLAAWTDRNPGSPDAVIVDDPLRQGNRVLGFNRTQSGGSIFTTDFVSSSGQFTVSFEYLGLAKPGSVAGDLGGFFGISQAFPGNHQWIAGTQDGFGQPINLIDDNTWRTYTLTFSSAVGQAVHLMFEDFSGSSGVSGDVFFDNIRFNDSSVTPAPFANVPEPGTIVLLGLGLAAAATARRRRN